jgi:hypothetical protein
MVEQHDPWLSQGDVFASVPIFHVYTDVGLTTVNVDGPSLVPALLITLGCQLDKRNRRGVSMVQYLHFLPIVALDIQNSNLQAILRREEINPAQAMYIGDVQEIGAAMVNVAETSRVPAAYFGPELRAPADAAAAQGDMYLFATKNDTRIGCISKERQGILRSKLSAYWSRIVA